MNIKIVVVDTLAFFFFFFFLGRVSVFPLSNMLALGLSEINATI